MNLRLLESILTQPTAPYRESHVIRLIEDVMTKAGVPFFQDRIGNLVLGQPNEKSVRRLLNRAGAEPVRLFIAHMDHPGFHGVRWESPKKLRVKWYGGSPTRHLNGAKVWIAHEGGYAGAARLGGTRLHSSGRWLETGHLVLDRGLSLDAREIYGGFGFRKPVWRKGKLIYTKAADDLIGVFTICSLALDPKVLKSGRFVGLLTRAEEVGFIGAIGNFELGWYENARRPVVVVSLEASRTLPGAHIGKGPVVRLGDRSTVFNPGLVKILSDVAQRKLKGRHQRRIMDGGSCEATAATAYGLPSVGISVPLGNYHNQSFEGGPDSRGANGPAPEFVHQDDIRGAIRLCQGMLERGLPWAKPFKKGRAGFRAHFLKARGMLKPGNSP